MQDVFSLWLGKTNEICRLCFKSWNAVGYKPIIYVDINNYDEFFKSLDCHLLDYKSILEVEINELYQFTDYFRFKRLYQEGGTWLDADMFLLRPLPNDSIIISTERTAQKGAYKNKIKELADIGVLRFPTGGGDLLLAHTLKKIINNKSKTMKSQKNMFYFQKILHNNPDLEKYKKYLAPAKHYIPINWSNVKDLYFGNNLSSKYGKEINTFDEVLESSYGVHLWNNLTYNKYKIDFSKIHKNCFFNQLSVFHNEPIICIPSYQRDSLLKTTTLQMLKNNDINLKIILFLKNNSEVLKYNYLKDEFDIDLVEVPEEYDGIGKTRTFIRQYFTQGQKILMIDDDIIDIKSKRVNFNLKDFFKEMFETMNKENVKFAGCCPYDNEYYMKEGYSTSLKYTGGHLIAEIIRKDPLKVDISHFEDYVANIEYFIRDKKLLRFNDVYVDTKYFNTEGGIVAHYGGLGNRKEKAKDLALLLEKKYEGYCKSYFKKKFSVYNLKLNSRKSDKIKKI